MELTVQECGNSILAGAARPLVSARKMISGAEVRGHVSQV